MVGTRLIFHPDINEFSLQNALMLAKASALAYESEADIQAEARSQWGMDQVEFIEAQDPGRFIFSGKSDTQVFIAANSSTIIISFRGTEPHKPSDWKTDFRFRKTKVELPNSKILKVHRGFWHALEIAWQPLMTCLRDMRTSTQSIWLTGHSLGGALASLAAFRLRYFTDLPVQGVYTFGQPRVGAWGFCNVVNREMKSRIFRFANNNDFVTFVPPFAFRYAHLGQLYYLAANDTIVKNGFSLPGAIWDRIAGLRDFGQLDHDMATYIRIIERNLN